MSFKGGLTFLSKKQFNPWNLRNVERVWLAEQQHAQEQKKLEQLRRETAEQESLAALKTEAERARGLTKSSDRIDWMYEAPMSARPSADEYLMGKEWKDPAGGELKASQAATAGAFAAAAERERDPVRSELDALAKIREDPLLEIKRQEHAAVRNVVENPVRMRAMMAGRLDELLAGLREARERGKEHRESKARHKIEKLVAKDPSGRLLEQLARTEPDLARKIAPKAGKDDDELLRRLHAHKRPAESEPAPAAAPPQYDPSKYGLRAKEGAPLPRRRESEVKAEVKEEAPPEKRPRWQRVRMSEEERREELERMRSDADTREDYKHRRVAREERHDAADEQERRERARETASEGGAAPASFIGHVASSAIGSSSVADRVRSRTSTSQRSAGRD